MTRTNRFQVLSWRAAATAMTVLAVSACGVSEQEAPSLTGPSGFAQSLQVTAAPQILARDGSSTSIITVLARNADGTPMANRRLFLDASAGTLASTEVNTSSDGRASTTYIAPGQNVAVNAVTIFVTPIEVGDRANTHGTTVILEVVGPDIPVPSFNFNPAAPAQFQQVNFDASTSFLSGAACGSVCSYAWDFADGSTDTGRFPTHVFQNQGIHLVTLTVTSPAGTFRSVSRVVNVAPAVLPTADFTFSPGNPMIFDQVFFDGSRSKGANGATIVSWEWNFGNGTYGVGVNPPAVTYPVDRIFQVTLTVTDSRGQVGTVTKPVAIAAP